VGDARTASTRYRLLAHLPALTAAGWAPEVRYPLSLGRGGALRRLWRALDLLRDVTAHRRPGELLFIQRKTFPSPFARRLPRPGRPVIFDMDDALYLPPPTAAAGAAVRRRHRRNLVATAAASDLVVVGNAELARELPHSRHALLPTAVDTERFSPARLAAPAGPSVGWVGHSGNLGYLEALADPLREVAGRHAGFRLIVVADRAPRLPGLEVEFREWSLETEVSCFDGIGVGLMPLEETPWARGKCAFKAIQYMALGIPAVVSPVGANRELVRHGENGFLASEPAAWIEALDALLSSPELAARVAAEGRRTVVARYSLEVTSRRLLELLRQVSP
jgi:glycosyltransferase involved in cell wall biosynthesis